MTEPEVADIVQDILNVGVDDSVNFTLRDIEEIREEADYPGYRVSIEAVLDKTRQTLKMDITTGDFVTPREIEYSFKLMFEDRTISIMAYNLETVLAEKFETVITRGIANTRMRDFYDIYVLTTTQVFDDVIFRTALKKTVEKRYTVKQMAAMDEVVQTVTDSTIMDSLWQRYQKKYSYAADITWGTVTHALKELAGKVDNV